MLTRKKTVASIMATFTKTIDDLRTVEEQCLSRSAALEAQIAEAETQLGSEVREASKAAVIANKLEDFIDA